MTIEIIGSYIININNKTQAEYVSYYVSQIEAGLVPSEYPTWLEHELENARQS